MLTQFTVLPKVPQALLAHQVWMPTAGKKICYTFKEASDDLFQAPAVLACRLCMQAADYSILAPLLVCRLIALNKTPGVCPTGTSKVPRRIISMAILYVIKGDIQEAAGVS